MAPALQDGDSVLGIRLPSQLIVPGMIACVEVSDRYFIVKRVTGVTDGEVWLESDNKLTSSSYCDTSHSLEKIVSIVLFRLPRSGFVEMLS